MTKKSNISISPEDLKISATGEVMIANPDLLSKLNQDLKISDTDIGPAADNYIGCGGNAYQCGKAMGDLDQLVNQVRAAKIR